MSRIIKPSGGIFQLMTS